MRQASGVLIAIALIAFMGAWLRNGTVETRNFDAQAHLGLNVGLILTQTDQVMLAGALLAGGVILLAWDAVKRIGCKGVRPRIFP